MTLVHLHRVLKEKYGPEYLSIFGAGTCGDVNHIDVSHDRPQKGPEEASRIGNTLGKTVAKRLDFFVPNQPAAFGVGGRYPRCSFACYTPEQVAAARAKVPKVGTCRRSSHAGTSGSCKDCLDR